MGDTRSSWDASSPKVARLATARRACSWRRSMRTVRSSRRGWASCPAPSVRTATCTSRSRFALPGPPIASPSPPGTSAPVASKLADAPVLAGCLGLSAAIAHADRTTIPGNSGTITLDWEATQDSKGRPLIVGRMITYGGMSGYCRPRLLVETLDAHGQVIAQRMGFIPGYVGGFDNVYLEEKIRAPCPAYGVRNAST